MSYRAFIILLLILTASCKKERFDIQNLNGGSIIALGHGGSGIHSLYPLSSASSILACLHTDADGSEFDVQLTLDSVLVAYHPADLAEETDLNGPISMLAWDQVKEARYTAVAYHDEHLVTLSDLFGHASATNDRVFSLDLKVYPGSLNESAYIERFARALVRLIEAQHLADRVYIESQYTYMLATLKAYRPDLKTFYYPANFEEGLALADELDLFGITISTEKCTGDQVRIAHEHGRWIALWDVYSRTDNEEAVRKNPEIIQTDKIEHLLDLLEGS
jgi:glycerophosphoryl diester phosphodiesterase